MRTFPHIFRAPDGGGAPTIDLSGPEGVRQAIHTLVKSANAAGKTTEEHQRVLDDVVGRLEAVERAKINPQPTDERIKDFSRFKAADGRFNLAGYTKEGGRVTKTTTFAGESFEAPVDGLFDSVPADNWQQDLQILAVEHKVARLLGAPGTKSAAKLLAHMQRAPLEIRSDVEKSVSEAIRRTKAMADVSGAGGEWVPDIHIGEIYRDFEVTGSVAAQFNDVPMAGANLIMPKLTVGARPYRAGVASSNDPAQYRASQVTTDGATITAEKFAVHVKVDDALAEDSIPAVLPIIMQEVVAAQTDGFDDSILNGDTAGSDTDVTGSWNTRLRWGSDNAGEADHRRAFIGLRQLARDRGAATDMGSNQTVAKIMEVLIGGMGENAASNLCIFVSPEVAYQKIFTDSNVLTVDKFGPNATILRGQIASIAGVPVIMTRWLTADLASTGLYTGSGAKSGVVVADRNAFRRYSRRQLLIESGKDIGRGQYSMVATARRTFQTLSASTRKVATFGYNWL